MADALVSVYVRPEGAYITSSDRTTVGVWMESGDWEFLPGDEPERVGAAVIRRLKRAPRLVRLPERDEFSTLRSEVIAPLLALAAVRSWKAFITPATLIDIQGGDAVTVTPMRRDGRGFSPLLTAREDLSKADAEALGRAVFKAARVLPEHSQ
jgi:hypothetical protein